MPDPAQGGFRAPSPADVRTMLSDICTNSEAEVSFDNLTFTINGSDDAVKAGMMVINQIPFVKRSQYQMRVKIELANEHKEFVSGKKNGQNIWHIPSIRRSLSAPQATIWFSTSPLRYIMSIGRRESGRSGMHLSPTMETNFV